MTRPPVVEAHPSSPLPVQQGAQGIGAGIRRRLGGTELSVFPIALGGSVFGWTAVTADTTRILDRYADIGGNMIDTADSYAAGLSEVQIGTWMRHRRNRDDLVVATKIGRHADFPGLGPVNMVRAVEASLERLGTDRIDLLYFHGDDPAVPLEDSLGTAQWLIDTGKVRAIGASDYSAERLVEARILAATGYPRFTAYETEYSLVSRTGFEGDRRLVARGQGLAIMPYFALANGFLTGKYRTRRDFGATARSARAHEHFTKRGLRVLRALDAVAENHSASVASVALAWLLTRPGVVAPVVSASRPEQVDALAEAAVLRLGRAEIQDLERASRH